MKRNWSWLIDNRLESLVQKKIVLMKELSKTEAQIEEFGEAHWQLSYIRRYFIDKHIEREEFDDAIAIQKESMDIDKVYCGLVVDYGRELKKLYLQTG